MNIFKVSKEVREKTIKDILDSLTPEELLEGLIEEGLEIEEGENRNENIRIYWKERINK